jgi:hypothetical protein
MVPEGRLFAAALRSIAALYSNPQELARPRHLSFGPGKDIGAPFDIWAKGVAQFCDSVTDSLRVIKPKDFSGHAVDGV